MRHLTDLELAALLGALAECTLAAAARQMQAAVQIFVCGARGAGREVIARRAGGPAPEHLFAIDRDIPIAGDEYRGLLRLGEQAAEQLSSAGFPAAAALLAERLGAELNADHPAGVPGRPCHALQAVLH